VIYFWQVFHFYNKPLRGLFYMPARWIIVPFEQIESYMPKRGLIIDIGCGEGVMSTLLVLSSPWRKVIGIDINKAKINLGKKIAREIPNLSFKHQDVFSQILPKADGFILSDFLHHIPSNKHKKLLKLLANSLNKNGVIMIKEIDLKDGLRSKVSRLFDFLFYPFEKVSFISSEELASFLTQLGLKVRIIKVKKWFPGSTTLFICQK